jgi:cell division protein FtsB
MNCKDCGRACQRGAYPAGGGLVRCRYCALRATGMTTSALRASFGARIKLDNLTRLNRRLRADIAKHEALEASMRERIDFLEDEIATMLDDRKTYEREMAKHGDK